MVDVKFCMNFLKEKEEFVSTYLYIVAEVVGHDAFNDIEADVGACVTHMTFVIDCWTARIPRHLIWVLCTEYFLFKTTK